MWASDHGYQILGTRFRVQSQDESTAAEMARLWTAFAHSSSAARLRNTFSIVQGHSLSLYRDCSQYTRGEPVTIIDRLLMEANRSAVAGYSGFAAHAAVVGTGNRLAAVVGESGAGKSTLAASAVLAGLLYASDEALCIDRESRTVVPYPKPIGLSADSQRLLAIVPEDMYQEADEAPVLAADLGGDLVAHHRRLTDIILPERSEKDEASFEPLAPADAVAALLGNSFNHYQDPEGSYLLTARLAAEVRTWRFTYSDAAASGKILAAFLADP